MSLAYLHSLNKASPKLSSATPKAVGNYFTVLPLLQLIHLAASQAFVYPIEENRPGRFQYCLAMRMA